MAAQTALAAFSSWIDDNDLLSLAADEGIGVVFWHVLDDGADSIKLLRDLLKRLDGREQLVVVRNFGRGNQFAAFDDSVEHTDAVQAGVHIIDLPALHQATMRKVDHLGASFWAAANNRDSLSVMDPPARQGLVAKSLCVTGSNSRCALADASRRGHASPRSFS